jgi:hypothetical protein
MGVTGWLAVATIVIVALAVSPPVSDRLGSLGFVLSPRDRL